MKYVFQRIIIGVLVGVCLLFARHAFAATTHHYVCSDFTFGSTASCTGSNVITLTGNNGYAFEPGTPAITLSPGTWYVTTGFNTGNFRIQTDSAPTYATISSTVTDSPITVGNQTSVTLDDSSGSFAATITDFCISDTVGGCGPGPSPVFPTGGATTTLEQTMANFNNGWWLYLCSFFGTIWLLRKRS